MGTQGPGRKRIPNREKLVAEDDALNQIAREAEARLAAKRAARAEAREIRMKELERQQKEEDSERYSRHSRRHASISDDEERMSVGSRGSLRPSDYSGFLGSSSRASSRASSARASPVVEDRMERDFPDKGSRTASTLSAATLASLGGASSRRGSCDTSFSAETEASIRDIKDSLAEAEEKYRKAMVSNAQLHNEKLTLIYQVDTLREELSDMEELLCEARRQHDDRTKVRGVMQELERERQAHTVLQYQFKEMRETLRKTEELLTEVSDLRVKSSSYCQEVSDLQEALQWKEKKIAALERQREISDIVRIERDRLKDEVFQLQDLLKKHGVVISHEISTNGDMGQVETDDDVTAESASQLAQELSRGGRESMLGQVEEQQPAEGSKPLQDNHCRIYDGSQSLNVIFSEQIKPDSVKAISKQRQNGTEKQMGTNVSSRKPSNVESEKDPTKTFLIRQSRSLLFRKVGNKTEPLTNESGTTAQKPKSGVPEELQDLRTYEVKTTGDTVEIQEKIQGNSIENNNQTKTQRQLTMLSFVPTEMLKDWTGLEKTIKSILGGFVEYQDLVTKISKMVPEIPYPLSWWISELEDKLKHIAGNVSTQCDKVEKKSTELKKTTAGCELPLKNFPEGGNTAEDPENVKQSAAGSSRVTKKHLKVAEAKISEAPSLEHPQPYYISVDSRIVCEDSRGIQEIYNQGSTENTCGAMSSLWGKLPLKALPRRSKHPQTCGFFVNSSDSRSTVYDDIQEHEVTGNTKKPDEKQSDSDPKLTSCPEDVVSIRSYFTEHSKTTAVESELGQGLLMGIVEAQAAGVVATSHQPRVCRKLQSSIVPVEETQLKTIPSLSLKPQVEQSSMLKWFPEVIAGQVEVMPFPEISLRTLQGRKSHKDGPIEKSSGGNTKSPEQHFDKDLNNCEEAAAQQPVTQQQHKPVMEVVDKEDKVCPVVNSVKHLKRFGLDNRKEKYKSQCKSS
ncbi:myosin heavy chain, non-muscle isoform X5 [Channa argus]|uniref:myosin heavy chain, non-muscle isoform X5 n=1 Tax=Channa argus TaxID=215402 RepID=UPI0035230F64